jgi:Uma2 family endonuclease
LRYNLGAADAGEEAAMTTEKTLLTAEQLFGLPEDGRRYELLDGVLVEMAPPGGEHSGIASAVNFHLRTFIEARQLDYLVGSEVGVVLQRNPDRVRAPDVYAIARNRLPGRRLPKAYLEVVPDLIVEVISPHDRAAELEEKLEDWLRAGARLVWVVYPRTRSILAHHGLSDVRVFREGDLLDAEPVLPDFACSVERLFAG